MNELMEGLLVSSVWMVVVALAGLDVMFYFYLRRPQTVIVWDGFSTEVVRHRVGFVAESGNFEVFGNGELSLPLGLKGRAGQRMEFLLVRRQKIALAYE